VTNRNYLFAQTQDDVALTRFIATAAAATGFLKGTPGGHLPGWYTPGEDNHDFLDTLYRRLEAGYPDGGQPFYAVRLWTNLLWQPAYLAVIGVHVHGALPAVTTLSQSRQNMDVDGYRLSAGPQMTGDTETLIAQAGRDLRNMAEALLVEINAVTRLKRVPSLRLLADRMLGLMVRLRHFRPEISIAEQYRYCALWLDAMGLGGQGRLETVDLGQGRQVAIMARKGCCLDYLAFPDRYCSSCPKLSDTERHARERASALAELDAAGDQA
jgi:siderophore ferric iron reductase